MLLQRKGHSYPTKAYRRSNLLSLLLFTPPDVAYRPERVREVVTRIPRALIGRTTSLSFPSLPMRHELIWDKYCLLAFAFAVARVGRGLMHVYPHILHKVIAWSTVCP